jgi:hypothetical protein
MPSAYAVPGSEENTMRLRLTINSFIGFLLLVVLGMAVMQARAQNQTPANVAPPVGWTDPATGLMWMTEDNGANVSWNQANAYCSNLRLGGYSDWRLPTIDELQGIYDPSINAPGQWHGEAETWHVKGNLKLSGWLWSSSQGSAPGTEWYFIFAGGGRRFSYPLDFSANRRALCVRR